MSTKHILALNCGSSSLKSALFSVEGDPQRSWTGSIERIGLPEAGFTTRTADGAILDDERCDIPDHAAALDRLLSRIEKIVPLDSLLAVGHRVVHGGPDCDCPMIVNRSLEARLQKLIPLAPLHLPHNLAGILAVKSRWPELLQITCFDTAFHQTLPRIARLTGLPRKLEDSGVRRYGFHGLSYEYVLADVRQRDGEGAAAGRLIVAHLGNGASVAAIKNGRSIETTMGFSGLGGLIMGTRSGDLDPGIILYLGTELGMNFEAIEHLLYRQSGLLGVSGVSRDMQDLLARQNVIAAAEAVDLFCYRAAQHIAALTVPLRGLDRLIFTGGIGANAPEIRNRICAELPHLGLEIDSDRNRQTRRKISTDASIVTVQAIPTDEELMIARHAADLVAGTREVVHG